MNKQALFAIIGVLAVVGLGGAIWAISSNSDTIENPTPTSDNQISVITTLYPQYDFTRTIAPDAKVELLLPAGTEPHSYEPTPRDIEAIQRADLFIYTGANMEPWVEDLIADLPQNKILDLSTSITLMESTPSHEHSEEDDHSHDEEYSHDHEEEAKDESSEDHDHEEFDPHYWLDFTNAVTMVETISAKLAEIDSTNADTYTSNNQTLVSELTQLDENYANTLSQCEENTLIIAGHSAFGYLTERYGLVQESAQGFSPNAEPSSTRVVELIELVNEKGARAVFSEELLSDRLAQTIANETGAQVLQITPAGNVSRDDLDANITFIDIMKSNLESFATGLSCR